MADETWNYILINGQSKQVEVLNPEWDKGRIVSIENLRPFDSKGPDGNPRTPTVDDANNLKRNLYIDFFRKPFKNLVILTGAGSSMDVGGPSMYKLWTLAKEKYKTDFDILKNEAGFNSPREDLEALLSQIDGYIKFAGDKEFATSNGKMKLSEAKEELLVLIKNNCTIKKPGTLFPHKVFLEKLLQRKQTSPRIKVFTLNYDLLFEFAANDVNAIVIDGFSFTLPRTFSGRFYDYDIVQREGSKVEEEDNFIQRVFHLHKLHGSLNWERVDPNRIEIKQICEKPLLVYPRESKYEDSYEQPFFEMMARFQRNLRLSGDTLLICIGYSFNDKHINAAIEEALNQNPGFRLAVIDPGFDSASASHALKEIKNVGIASERVLLVAETFTEFANYFPEVKTYDVDSYAPINLKNVAN